MRSHPGLVIPRRLLTPFALAVIVASCGETVAPVVPVATSVRVDASALAFSSLGAERRLVADVFDQNGAPMAGQSVIWSSDDAGVASVSADGTVRAVSNGATTVRARSGSAEGEVGVSVSQSAVTLSLAPDSVLLNDPGDERTLVPDVRDALGSEVVAPTTVWWSSDTAVVVVDTLGTVRAVGTGTTFVGAASGAGADSVRVRVAPELVLAVVGTATRSGTVDEEVALSVRVRDVGGDPYGGATVTWAADPGSGSIGSAASTLTDATGHTAAVWRLGTVAGTQRASASIQTRGRTETVVFDADAAPGPAVRVALAADTILLSARGETAFLAPAGFDAYDNATVATAVSFTSSDPAVAGVSAEGLVTGGVDGTAWVRFGLDTPMDSVEVTVLGRGAITLTFDDGWLSVYDNAWPVLTELGFRANVGVYTDAVTFPAYMSEAQLSELHAAGWSMVSHTTSHDTLTVLSDGDLDYELRASREWLDARGFRGSNVLVAPYHEFGERERDFASRYYVAARGTSADLVTPDTLVSWMPDRPYDLTGIDAEALPYTTVAGRDRLRALLQRVTDEGAFLDVYFHKVPPENVDALRATLAVLEDFEERVLPYHELYPVWARSVF